MLFLLINLLVMHEIDTPKYSIRVLIIVCRTVYNM